MAVNYFDPATIFCGEWERIMDKFLLGSGAIYASGQAGGEATHTLTANEIPNHKHDLYAHKNEGSSGRNIATVSWDGSSSDGGGNWIGISGATGGGAAHNNMPPYLTVNIWKRIA